MAIIPKASQSGSEGFRIPDEGTYRARLVGVTDADISKFDKPQERFEWELTDEDGEVLENTFYDYVNISSFFDGGGDPTRMSRLYKIVRAIQGPDFDPEASGDTMDLVGSAVTVNIEHGLKQDGSLRAIITSYKHPKRKAKAAARRDAWDDDEPEF